ncbi:TetR/AcrR family transcriptional regulator [Streptomyces sp.]|uniref:TetR/AcrR family transcriptional regulator n=1 Tax=Streptomyces sp. TaxID=1931 RepID=UPI002D79AD1E|nr:TetR/AcrR family transcriptional regulator [Streptomyces sp.]
MMRTEGTGKSGYHHGDLRNALIEAATDLARDGGPEAVVLRAAARRVGVSPTAAYRHFAGQGDLLHAVKERGQRRLAETMERSVRAVESTGDAGVDAVERLKALGLGYVRFALAEPGLFRTAFCLTPLTRDGTGEAGPDPDPDTWMYASYRLLVEALDTLVTTGRMPAARRPGAEVAAWGTVHGLAMLFLEGPLVRFPADQRDTVVAQAVTTIVRGLTAPE